MPAWACDGPAPPDVFRWRPDVCFLHMSRTPALDESLVDRVPTVLYTHGYYATCATGLKCNGWGTKVPCSRRFGIACLPLNYAIRCGVRNPLRLWDNFRTQSARIRLLPRFRHVLTNSRHMAEEMKRHGAARVTVAPLFPTGVRPALAPPPRRPFTGRILFAGRFTAVKGGDLLVEAAKAAAAGLGRTLAVVFAGNGPEEQRWKALAARVGVAAEFHGWCAPERLAQLRTGADLLAVPSLWPEPFGLVGIEAGCEGLPAVGFAVGGIPDWLVGGESGELAPSLTAAGLAAAIVRALTDPDHHHRLRLGAWEMARRFTLEKHLSIVEPALAGDAGVS
jgi:glycosyltransferase involved in cell wall biosynthesis